MKILILDIDLTLNLEDPKQVVKLAASKGFHKYSKEIWDMFRASAEDMSVLPHPIPYKHLEEVARHYDRVAILTSRLEDWKQPTRRWLKKWGFRFDDLYMRPSGIYEVTSAEIKKTMITKLEAKWGKDIDMVAIDDDRDVIDYYKSIGIKTFTAPNEWEKVLKYHKKLITRKAK